MQTTLTLIFKVVAKASHLVKKKMSNSYFCHRSFIFFWLIATTLTKKINQQPQNQIVQKEIKENGEVLEGFR